MTIRSIAPRIQPKPAQWLLRSKLHHRARRQHPHTQTRNNSTNSNPSPPNPNIPPPSTSQRADRLISRLPRPIQKYASRLRSAPLSHIVAFGVLHEITAVVPLLGLFGLFHYTNYVPLDYAVGRYGGYAVEATGRFERYFTRKGWFGFGQEVDEDTRKTNGREAGDEEGRSAHDIMLEKWRNADGKYKIVVEAALAYAVTKALLPARIAVSLWATPWFAGVLGRLQRIFRRSR